MEKFQKKNATLYETHHGPIIPVLSSFLLITFSLNQNQLSASFFSLKEDYRLDNFYQMGI